MSDNTAVTVRLLERDIQLACPPDEVDNLHAVCRAHRSIELNPIGLQSDTPRSNTGTWPTNCYYPNGTPPW